MVRLRNYLIAGLIVLLPLYITFYILRFLFLVIDGLLAQPLAMLGLNIPGLGFILVLLILLGVGFLANNFFGKKLIGLIEWMMARLPIIKSVYNGVKQIIDAFSAQQRTAFQKVVLVEYPRQGLWSMAFLTGSEFAELDAKTGKELVSVFLPTTPNPTTGFLLFLPKEHVQVLDMTVDTGMRMIISAGVAKPGLANNCYPRA
jgi:uncharacterized membrane protein